MNTMNRFSTEPEAIVNYRLIDLRDRLGVYKIALNLLKETRNNNRKKHLLERSTYSLCRHIHLAAIKYVGDNPASSRFSWLSTGCNYNSIDPFFEEILLFEPKKKSYAKFNSCKTWIKFWWHPRSLYGYMRRKIALSKAIKMVEKEINGRQVLPKYATVKTY